MDYIYHGDRHTDVRFKKQNCNAVRRENGKCIRGRNGNFLVEFENGERAVVVGRLLRKNKSLPQI